MNPSSSSLHSKAAGLTQIFSPDCLSILDMSPSIASTMDQCQTHFAQQWFFFSFFFYTVNRTIAFLENEALHKGRNLKKGVLRQCTSLTLFNGCKMEIYCIQSVWKQVKILCATKSFVCGRAHTHPGWLMSPSRLCSCFFQWVTSLYS